MSNNVNASSGIQYVSDFIWSNISRLGSFFSRNVEVGESASTQRSRFLVVQPNPLVSPWLREEVMLDYVDVRPKTGDSKEELKNKLVKINAFLAPYRLQAERNQRISEFRFTSFVGQVLRAPEMIVQLLETEQMARVFMAFDPSSTSELGWTRSYVESDSSEDAN